MRFSLLRTLAYLAGGLWTASGGRKRIEAKQLRNLQCLVEKVRTTSPLFARLYKNLGPSSEIRLSDLPVTHKRDLMREFDEWLTIRSLSLEQVREHLSDIEKIGVPLEGVAVFRTSGTSGEPAVIVLAPRFLEYCYGITLARLDRTQWRLALEERKSGVKVILTGGNGHFAGVGFERLMRQILPRLTSTRTFIDAEQPIASIVEKLNAIPYISSIMTYPSMLAILAKEQEASRLRIRPFLFRTGGETLTDELRKRVRSAFPDLKHDIVDTYASTECLVLSFSCGSGRLHVNEDWVILEAVDDAMQPIPDGTLSSNALLTVLANDTQPFIRYDLGDCVRFHTDQCPCGSPFRSFQVEGRDATLLRVGEVTLSPLIFDLEHEEARRVQLVQTGQNDFEVRIEPVDEADFGTAIQDIVRKVESAFHAHGLQGVTVRESAEPPQLTASGKFHEVLPWRNGSSPS
ncbi:phenylacetate--CoA ligase family protein [Croceicoccus gelatinilyticus]|uniref:phenylacetate--CoA ligase family protein n=1 Tax=Croceicoccus gelatinilyticus TaxID=2835536 RepID=UPI001BCE070C|nr:hypothetical protein [Croceicoccus gelatinilyticus]MBS7671078.1 phenylacetate--CoA ligase family protein [Croceicoccus gelatinilyticus]